MKKIEIKAKKFAKEYVKNNFNAVKTAMKLYNLGRYNGDPARRAATASTIAYVNLQKPVFQKAILEELEKAKLTDELAAKIHKRNLTQNINLPASNTALDLFYRIKGYYEPKINKNLNLNIDLTALDAEIENTLKELRELDKIAKNNDNTTAH